MCEILTKMNFKQKKNALKNENIGWMQQPNTNKQHETCHKIKKENLQLKLIRSFV